MLDGDGDGVVSIRELHRGLTSLLGNAPSPAEFAEVVTALDPRRTGAVPTSAVADHVLRAGGVDPSSVTTHSGFSPAWETSSVIRSVSSHQRALSAPRARGATVFPNSAPLASGAHRDLLRAQSQGWSPQAMPRSRSASRGIRTAPVAYHSDLSASYSPVFSPRAQPPASALVGSSPVPMRGDVAGPAISSTDNRTPGARTVLPLRPRSAPRSAHGRAGPAPEVSPNEQAFAVRVSRGTPRSHQLIVSELRERDPARSGFVTRRDFDVVLRSAGVRVSPSDASEIARRYGASNGCIAYERFAHSTREAVAGLARRPRSSGN
jgi:Ca2+-binding EF-hand superfamily protein